MTGTDYRARLAVDEAPVLADLERLGYSLEHAQDLYLKRYDYRSAIPALLQWLPVVTTNDVKEMIVRALAVPWARGIAVPVLVREFRSTDDPSESGYRWAIGNALEVTGDREHLDDLIALAQDRSYGRARQMVVLGLGRIKDPRATAALRELLADPVVDGHAVSALARLKPPDIETLLTPFLKDERGWVRTAARRAIEGSRRRREKA